MYVHSMFHFCNIIVLNYDHILISTVSHGVLLQRFVQRVSENFISFHGKCHVVSARSVFFFFFL
jgi:hypothetical protein